MLGWRSGRVGGPGGRRRRVPLPGSSPGLLVVDPEAPKPRIRVFSYGPEEVVELEPEAVEELEPLVGARPVTWVDVSGLGDADVLRTLGQLFDVHPLALEDAVSLNQRAKAEIYGDAVFLVARMGRPADELDTEQICFFVREGVLVSFQEKPGDNFDRVRDRIRGTGRMRRAGADYLAYALLDAVIDGYFPLLESFGDRLETLEEKILDDPDEEALAALHQHRRVLIGLRKSLLPHREAINTLMRDPVPAFTPETQLFLRDCYDHTLRVVDLLESYREFASSLMEIHLSAISNRTNEVMKVLTMIATIFIPLSFLAGVYGMNFETSSPWNMPELGWRFGYPTVLGGMAVVALGFLWYFRRKGWF